MTGIQFRNPQVRMSAALASAEAAVREPSVTLRELLAMLGEQGLLVFCGVLAYAASVWRLAAAERTPPGDDDELPRAPHEPPFGGTRIDGAGLASSGQPGI